MKNKVAIITGGSSGIGAAIALAFAKEGSNIVITYKENETGANEIKSKIESLGVKYISIQADLTIEDDTKKVINQTIDEFGKLDVLVNNAGRYIAGDEWNGESEIWIKSLQQNLVSVMSVSKYAIEVFQKQKSGVIINISSRYSKEGQFDALSYSAAKAGIANITQAYAKLLAPFGRVNAISPGAVNTGYWSKVPKEELEENINSIPMQRLVDPEEIAELALFLVSDKASMITGQNIFVDGGFGLNKLN